MEINGAITVLKPPGMSSSNVVSYIRRMLNIRKVGHCGTLDPGACGVLKICIGRATKLCDYLMDSDKVYIAELTFGKTTDTLDSFGVITNEDHSNISESALKKVLTCFTGDIEQYPPQYSAIKVNGQPMYRFARKGVNIDIKKRIVNIKGIDLISFKENKALLKIRCSKGTYIRSLCRDIANALGTVGYMSFLVRTYSSYSEIGCSYTLEELCMLVKKGEYSFIQDIDAVLSFMKKVVLDDYLFPIITTGGRIDINRIRNKNDFHDLEFYAVYCKNLLIGIGVVKENELSLKTMLYQKGYAL